MTAPSSADLSSKARGVLKALSRGGRPNRSLLYETTALTELWKRSLIASQGNGYVVTEAGHALLLELDRRGNTAAGTEDP